MEYQMRVTPVPVRFAEVGSRPGAGGEMQSIPRNVASRTAVRDFRAALWVPILTFLFAMQSALAQDAGSIQGTVTDASGAPIFGAVVAVEGGGDSRMTVTDIE